MAWCSVTYRNNFILYLYREGSPSIHWTEGQADLRAGLDVILQEKISHPYEIQSIVSQFSNEDTLAQIIKVNQPNS
jgi:hypothetical protein